MKGSIVQCLEELVVARFGKEAWETVLQRAGVKNGAMFLPFQDVDDGLVKKMITAVCDTLHLSLPQAANAFGEHWITVYSQRFYAQYYAKYHTAKEFFLGLDAIHVAMTKNIPNAKPPQFDFEWKTGTTLILHYTSQRGLIDFVVGLAKGVGTFYHEDLQVKKLNNETVEIYFRSASSV